MGITTSDYAKLLDNVNRNKGKGGKQQTKKPSKFKNVETFYDGKKFDSKKECARYKELKILKVKNLECQVKYPISINGVKICSYIADFVYDNHNGVKVVEDVKSEMTRKLPVYRLKKKLMKAVYDIEIKEV